MLVSDTLPKGFTITGILLKLPVFFIYGLGELNVEHILLFLMDLSRLFLRKEEFM